MSEPGKSAGTVQPHNSYLLVLFLLPASIITIFATTLFAGFVGNQATEIAKLILEIELSCQASGIVAAMEPLDPKNSDTNLRTCHDYLPKVVGFYALAAIWCVGSFFATAHLGQGLKSQHLRYWWSALVAVSVPLIILVKYWVDGQHGAYFPISSETSSVEDINFPIFSFILVVLLGALLLLLAWQFSGRNQQTYNRTVGTMFWLSIVAFVAISILFAYSSGNPYDRIGSINIIILFVLLTYLFMTGLFFYGQKTGWPVAGIFLLYFISINVIGGNDNQIKSSGQSDQQPVHREADVLDWLEHRKDFGAYPGGEKKYPIYIIASSGGGMYAAMRTAYYLESLQKNCPRFLHHTFAISSVSGGAIGALAYAAGQQATPVNIDAPCNFDNLTTSGPDIPDANQSDDRRSTIDKFFEYDVVSSIVGGGLFPGLLRRLSPLPLPGRFDRASAFRLVLSNSWRQAVGKNLRNYKVRGSTCTIASYFSDCRLDEYWTRDGNFPVMIFNATWVDIGMPTVLSNLSSDYFSGGGALTTIVDTFDVISRVKLVDGASISARFPIALPAGVLTNTSAWKEIRLVDGGYFDNSGLMAATAVAQQVDLKLKSAGLQNRAEVQLIYLGENYNVDRVRLQAKYGRDEAIDLNTPKPVEKKSRPRSILNIGQWFSPGSDLGAHGETLFRARDQRSLETVRLLRESADRRVIPGARKPNKLISFEWIYNTSKRVKNPCGKIPLAWYLAPCSRNTLKTRIEDSLFNDGPQLSTLQEQLSP